MRSENYHDSASYAPFRLVGKPSKGSYGLMLRLRPMLARCKIFEERRDEGWSGHFFDWDSIARLVVAERLPELKGQFIFGSDIDSFIVAGPRAPIEKLGAILSEAYRDDALLRDLLSRAELDLRVAIERGSEDQVDRTRYAPFVLLDRTDAGKGCTLSLSEYAMSEKLPIFAEYGDRTWCLDWISVAQVAITEWLPEVRGQIDFDPDAGIFCACGARAPLEKLGRVMQMAFHDDVLLRDLRSRAKLD